MSTAESTIRPRPRIPNSTKAAIIAAVGAGMSQIEAAQQFGVHPNTVMNLWRVVRQDKNPANPANLDWKSHARTAAQGAVIEAMTGATRRDKDIYAAGNIALKVLYGTGDLTTSSQLQVEGNVQVTFAWQPVQDLIEGQVVDQCAVDGVVDEDVSSTDIPT